MSVDMKLHEASRAVRRARAQADFSVKTPASNLRLRGPMIAVAGAAVIAALFAVPALLPEPAGTGSSPAVSNPAPLDPQSDIDSEPGEFPHLALASGMWWPTVVDETTDEGTLVETMVEYNESPETFDPDNPNAVTGRLARVQVETVPTDHVLSDLPPRMSFTTDLLTVADSSDPVQIRDGDGIFYTIPNEGAEEASAPVMVTWIEEPGYLVSLTTWGVGRDETLSLAEQLVRVVPGAWAEMRDADRTTQTTTARSDG